MATTKIDIGDVVVWHMNPDLMNYQTKQSPDESAWGIGIVSSIEKYDYMNPVEVWNIYSYLMEHGQMNHGFFEYDALEVISKCDFNVNARIRQYPKDGRG